MGISFEGTVHLIITKLTTWYEAAVAHVPNILIASFVFFLSVWIGKKVKNLVTEYLPKVSDNNSINSLAKNLIYIVIVTLGAFFALEVVGLDKAVTSLLAGAGVVGIALGFAFQEIASNFISGILIALQEPYKINDVVEVEGVLGTITKIELRTTSITTFQGLEVFIPNKDMFTKPIINYTSTPKRRVDLDVGVSYADDLEKVEKVTREAISTVPELIPGLEIEVFFSEFGDSSINLSARFWIRYSDGIDYYRARHLGVMAIKKAYDQNDITIPFPIRTLDFGIKGGKELGEVYPRL